MKILIHVPDRSAFFPQTPPSTALIKTLSTETFPRLLAMYPDITASPEKDSSDWLYSQTTESCGGISDGYHTFDELYEHRVALFLMLLRLSGTLGWWSRKHHDGTMYDGYIIAGLDTPNGPVTYHMKDSYVSSLTASSVKELPSAPEWDGSTPTDCLNRLTQVVNS